MSRRTLRHPFGGGRWFARPAKHTRPSRRPRVRQPRIRPRRQMNVAAMVASPEERSSRPSLRLTIVGAIVLALFGLMVLRLWTLQVIDTKTYAAAVNANHLRSVVVPAPRGDIVDRADTALVDNAVSQNIVISARLRTTLERQSVKTGGKVVLLPYTQSQKTEIGKIATLASLTPAEVEKAIENQQLGPYQDVPILPNAPAATVQFLEAHQSEYPGLSVQSATQRSYPQGGTLATQTLGYTATSPKAGQQYLQVGANGLEAEYNQYLTGKPGKQFLEVNATGTVVGTVNRQRPEQGDNLVTNLDLGLQQAVQTALDNDITADSAVPDNATGQVPKPNNAAAVVLDVRTGAVLAMASYPTYDNNEWVGGISSANYAALQGSGAEDNYAIQGLYTPGSTFKLITATAALQDGLITPGYAYDDTGSYTAAGCSGSASCTLHDDDNSGQGVINVSQAITASSDVFFYNIGAMFWQQTSRFGQTPIQDTAAQYGLTTPTGIDLPNESTSRVDSQAEREKLHKEDPSAYRYTSWYTGDNMEVAFGQGGTVVTPIGLADAYATFANGGTRYQPEVGAAIVNQANKVVKTIAPKVTGHVTYSPANYQALLAGFEGVINSLSGTAYQTFQQDAFFPMSQYVIAGKTGTADTNHGEPNAWFVSFGPNPNPQYAVAVVVNQGGYGAAAAAPAVAAIWNYLYTNPVPPLQLPTAKHPVTTTPPPSNPPAAPPTTTTTTAPGTAAATTPSPAAATGTG